MAAEHTIVHATAQSGTMVQARTGDKPDDPPAACLIGVKDGVGAGRQNSPRLEPQSDERDQTMAANPISRFPVPDIEELPDDIKERILAVQEKAGFVPNVFLVLAHRPDEFRAFFAFHDALMEKEGGGSMVAISSPGSFRVLPEYAVVGASKAAIESLTRYLAVELAPRNIVVNAVSPGIVATEALQHFTTMQDKDLLVDIAGQTPAGRIVIPEDVAQVVAFLCTPAAEMIRGQTLIADGGFTLPVSGIQRPG